jgi:hypothetical protein
MKLKRELSYVNNAPGESKIVRVMSNEEASVTFTAPLMEKIARLVGIQVEI